MDDIADFLEFFWKFYLIPGLIFIVGMMIPLMIAEKYLQEEDSSPPPKAECQVVSRSETEVDFRCTLASPSKEPLPAVYPEEKSNTPPLFDIKDSPINLKRTKSNEKDPMCLNDCSHLPRSSK